jgi:hypothetical protein
MTFEGLQYIQTVCHWEGHVRANFLLPLGGLHVKHAVRRGIWVPTQHLLWPRKTSESLDRARRSKDLPDAIWLLASSQALNTRTLTLGPICAASLFDKLIKHYDFGDSCALHVLNEVAFWPLISSAISPVVKTLSKARWVSIHNVTPALLMRCVMCFTFRSNVCVVERPLLLVVPTTFSSGSRKFGSLKKLT